MTENFNGQGDGFVHPDIDHPRKHRRSFARFAMWFADWQGTPTFVALLTVTIIGELLWNQVIAPLAGAPSLVFDPSTWVLNLGLSLLASYASSLSVMGGKVQSDAVLAELQGLRADVAHLKAALASRRGGEPVGETTEGGDW